MDAIKGASKLSRQQRHILDVLWEQTTYIEGHGNEFAKAMLNYWGVRWYPAKGFDDWKRSDSATISRALRRLEHRGLVERKNEISDRVGRTTRVKLTAAGIAIAKRLTKTQSENVNHLVGVKGVDVEPR